MDVSGLFWIPGGNRKLDVILPGTWYPNTHGARKERETFIDNLLVRVRLIIEMSRPALRHGSLNSLFQVALYLPSYGTPHPPCPYAIAYRRVERRIA